MSTKIQKVQPQPNFPELEDRINIFWSDNKIFEKSVEQKDADNPYIFVDGPPFPSGMPHYGHLLQSIGKDVIPRYWTMKGKRVRRVWGWDCHGIPVEAKVNKKLGIYNKKQVETEIGVAQYVKECRKYVESCIADWKWYIDKAGRWVDMDNAYYTMKPEFHESVLWAFKQIWDKGLIYKGKRVSLYSTDTFTPVSEFEVAEANDWRDIEDLSIFAKFKLRTDMPWNVPTIDPKRDIFMLAWTTTPWTIPSNFALGVNPNYTYCLVEFEKELFILNKDRLAYTFDTTETFIGTGKGKLVQIIKEFSGAELEGLEYEPIYDFFAKNKTENDHKVYLTEDVTNEDGTGVLHIAPGFGEVDFQIGLKYGLSDTQDIDAEGKMTVGDWSGVYLRDASSLIAEDMNKKSALLRSESYTHRLPFFRGDNPLIYMVQDAYFINIQKVKARMLELNEKVNWVPDNMKNRMRAVIETAPDWCISRNRYWATIMPLWKSEEGDEIVVGGFEEMTQYTDQIEVKEINGKKEFYVDGNKMSAHRDVCDQLVFKKDGKEYHRVPEIMDVWFDSGSAPFAQFHYPFDNKELFDNGSPADFVMEGLGQVRAWFNVMLRISTMLFDDMAYQNVICTGNIGGNDGRKMSKTYGNYPDPKDVLEKIGGEALRLYLMGSAVMSGGEAEWSDEVLSEQTKNILIPVWNTYKYLSIYAELHNWNPENAEFSSNNILDKWLESYLNAVTLAYSNALEAYDIPTSVKLIQPCIDNISAWWIRRSRDRFVEGNLEAMQTLYAALVRVTKTFAPQMAFVTEEIYQNLVRNTELKSAKESVHLENFPVVTEDMVDDVLLTNMDDVRAICSIALKVRDDNKIKLRQPLKLVKITSSNQQISESEDLIKIIKEELNVKEVKFTHKKSAELVVELDTKITKELREEGLLNEVARGLQNLRKTSGFKMGELVNMQVQTVNQEVKDIIEKFQKEICARVSANSIKLVENLESETKMKIEEEQILVKLDK